MKFKLKKSDYVFDLGNLMNEKASIEWKIDKDQRFIANSHLILSKDVLNGYIQNVQDLQNEYRDILKRIENLKTKIDSYG